MLHRGLPRGHYVHMANTTLAPAGTYTLACTDCLADASGWVYRDLYTAHGATLTVVANDAPFCQCNVTLRTLWVPAPGKESWWL